MIFFFFLNQFPCLTNHVSQGPDLDHFFGLTCPGTSLSHPHIVGSVNHRNADNAWLFCPHLSPELQLSFGWRAELSMLCWNIFPM